MDVQNILAVHKKRVIMAAAAVVLLLLILGILVHLKTPIIKANNIEFSLNKISSNAEIKITFNQLMNRKSVEEGFKIFPEIGGEFKWFLNQLTFTPEERFKVSETYTITLSGNAKNILGKPMGKDTILSFLVIDPPKVSLAVPNGETPVDSKITVMFDRPMTELTTYDTVESRDFPLTILPALPGRFKWIGTSAFQYIPEERLAYSSSYTATLPAGIQALDSGTFEQEYTFTFQTPRIALLRGSTIMGGSGESLSASTPYALFFNQDVNLESVLQHVTVKDSDGEAVSLTARYEKRKEGEKEIEDKKVVKLLPAKNDWGYDSAYTITITKEIAGIEGNLFSENEVQESPFRTKTFLVSTFPEAGALRANPFGDITLRFDQEVDLGSVRNYFSSKPEISFKANYGKKCDPDWEPKESPDEECAKIDDLTVVVFTPKEKLQNNILYEFRLDKKAKAKNGLAHFKHDEVWSFTTADTFKILRSDPVPGGISSYRRVCLFTSTFAETKDLEKIVTFAPASKGKVTISAYGLYFPQTTYPEYYDYGDRRSSKKPCAPIHKNEHYALEISSFLDPNTTQSFVLNGSAKDTFTQSLGADFTLNFKTEPLQDIDTDLELLQKNFYSVTTVDQHALPVFRASNLTEYTLEICKISADRFIEIDTEYARAADKENVYSRRYKDYGFEAFEPSSQACEEYRQVSKKLTKSYWENQYSEINLAQELGHTIEPGHYYLRASSPSVYRLEPLYTYDQNAKRDIRTGDRKVFIRPSTLLEITNMHVAVKQSREQALFWITNLASGQPEKGVRINLFSAKGARISGETFTDGNGIAKMPLHDLPFTYAKAVKGNDEVMVGSAWSEGISPWDFQISYSPAEPYVQAYVYTERPLYQPTHEVFLKGILRDDKDAVLKLPEATSIEVEIFDSRDTSIYKKNLSVNQKGTFGDSLKLDATAPLGRYTIFTCTKRNQYGDCVNGRTSSSFYVEEYRKPEYELKTTFSKEDYVDQEELRAVLNAKYFFGAPVADSKISWAIRAQNYYFDEYEGEWFSFTDFETFRKCYWGCPYEDQYIAQGEGKTSEDGQFIVTHSINLSTKDPQGKIKPPDSSKIYTVDATVQDKNNQSVSASESVIVHRGEFYVGVKNEAYIVGVGEKMPIKVITVDHHGKPLSGKSVEIELLKQEWKYVKKKNIDGGFYWENELDQKSIKKASVTTDSDGKEKYDFTMKDGGEYIVRATGKDSLGNTFSSTVDFYVTTEKTVHWKQENNNRMELKLDKVSYDVGETAKILVKSPYENVKALLTTERGDILSAKVVEINSNAALFELPITDKMIPNVYVSVLEAKGGDKNDPPDFKLGIANLVVDAKNKVLNISVKTNEKRYQPRERVTVEITTTDRHGNPVSADLSIAAVDASLLALKGNPKRDLVSLFYNRRGLGVLTADNLVYLLERINLSDLKGAKGGSGKGADEFGKVRGKFEDTAFWRGSLSTDNNGKLVTSFELPDNLTTWNIEVIGSTTNSLFGSTNETITTQKPVILRPVLPRFALFKDELRLGAIVHNFTEKDGKFTVGIETKNLTVTDSAQKTISIPVGGSEKVMWNTVVPKVKTGTLATVTMSVKGNNEEDAVRQEFPIGSYSTPETVSLSSFTDDISFTEKVLLPDTIDPELGELKITTGATLATYISDSLNYLIQFPYGCTEQIISQLTPNVVLKNAISLPNLKDKIKLEPLYDEKGNVIHFDTLVSKNLQKLYDSQRPDGGWGYFPESRESYPYVTSYIIFGLEQLKKAGYSVDGRVVSRAVSFIQDYMRSNRDLRDTYTGKLHEKTSYWANNRAYMLFVMAETSRGDLGLANNLFEDQKLLSNGGKAYLAMTLHTLSKSSTKKVDDLIRALENQARIDARGTYVRNDVLSSSFDMMSHVKITALTTQALNRIQPDHPLLPKLIKWLIAVRKDGRWDTTQDTVTTLIALTEFLERSRETEANYAAKIALNKKAIHEYKVDSKNILDQQEVIRAISDLKLGGDGNTVVFTKDGSGRLYYDMVLRYFLPIDEIKPRGEGFNIERNYYAVEDTKMEHPLTEAKAGETLRGHLTIVVPEERTLTAVENFLPAGFELVNFEFKTSDKRLLNEYDECYPCDNSNGYYYGFSPWTHKELRSDRLFLFADRLSKGVYEYDYYVNVTSEGKFHNPPAVVSEMYFPENFGRTKGEWMTVKE